MEHKDLNLMLKTLGQNPDLVIPYGNNVVVKLFEVSAESAGGVLLPDEVVSRDRQILARVVAVGHGQRSITTGEPMACFSQPGDLVIVLKHAPIEIVLAGEKFHVVFEGDIVGKVNEAKLSEKMEENRSILAEKEKLPEVVETYDDAVVSKSAGGILVVTGKE
jgi:co-chaperonin GroES (HSP10)